MTRSLARTASRLAQSTVTERRVALYRYLAVIDTALVLAIRAQREAGYTRS